MPPGLAVSTIVSLNKWPSNHWPTVDLGAKTLGKEVLLLSLQSHPYWLPCQGSIFSLVVELSLPPVIIVRISFPVADIFPPAFYRKLAIFAN